MTRDAVIFGISGTMFGLIVGWIIGSQQAPRPVAPAAQQSQTSSAPAEGAPAPKPVDVQRAMTLEAEAKSRPTDAAVRTDLGNLYFDARRFDQAIPWYQASLAIDPKNVNVSTDLAVAYYETQDHDRALKQLDHSLSIDPRHGTTLLNQGIIRAFGKRDLAGARESWEKVVRYAPDSPEAARARQGLDGIAASQGSGGSAEAGGGRGSR